MTDQNERDDSQTPPMRVSDQVYVVLRNEIIEAERSGSDFLKWKLIAAATVASVSVGFWTPAKEQATDARLIVCLIPLICAYVDMVSLDLAIRTIVIATFLRTFGDPYEAYVHRLRRRDDNPFHAATIASHGSSLAASVLILGLGLFGSGRGWNPFHSNAFITSGVLGVLLTALLWNLYKTRFRRVAMRMSDIEDEMERTATTDNERRSAK